MIKKLLASVLTIGALVTIAPSTSAFADTYHTVSSYDQYLGQTVLLMDSMKAGTSLEMAAGVIILKTES